METNGPATLLRVFVGESDKVAHVPMHEAIVREARAAGLAGATAWSGLLSFGRTSHVRSAKVLDLSADLPMVIEIVDRTERIEEFLPTLNQLFDKARCGGLATLERVDVIHYLHGPDDQKS